MCGVRALGDGTRTALALAMRISVLVSVLVLLTVTAQAEEPVRVDVALAPTTSIRPETRRAMLRDAALGLGASLVVSAGLGTAVGFGLPPRGREDPLPAFSGIFVGVSTLVVSAPSLIAIGLDRAGRKDHLRGGIGPAWGASFATLVAGGLLTTGLMFAPLDYRGARAVLFAMPAATLASSLGFGYLAYRRRGRRARSEQSVVRAFVAPVVARDVVGLAAAAQF